MENSSLKFSIVIPTFNRAKFLKEAILSVLTQTYVNWELIVIDDGGTDDTGKMIAEFDDERIRYFWQENRERGAARNAGVTKSSGDYVFFLDSDDFILPEYLQYARVLIGENQPECLHIPYILTDGKNLGGSADLRHWPESLLQSNKFACQIILRRDIAHQFKFSENRDLKIGEDWLLVLKLLHLNWVIGEQKLGRIRQHKERTMYFPSLETLAKSKKILKAELSQDGKFVGFPALFENIDLEFNYLEILALIHQKASKREICERLKTMMRQKSGFIFTKRFWFLVKHLILCR